MRYYLDSAFGCDKNDGLTPETAWETLTNVNATTFLPGDEILLKKGSIFFGQLHPQGDGTAEKPIRIGTYGCGDKPIIDGGGSYGTREGNFLEGAAVLFYNQN